MSDFGYDDLSSISNRPRHMLVPPLSNIVYDMDCRWDKWHRVIAYPPSLPLVASPAAPIRSTEHRQHHHDLIDCTIFTFLLLIDCMHIRAITTISSSALVSVCGLYETITVHPFGSSREVCLARFYAV